MGEKMYQDIYIIEDSGYIYNKLKNIFKEEKDYLLRKIETEQLEALTEYQKELEQYYGALAKKNPDALYYERRANQYKKDRINPANIVNIENQIKDYYKEDEVKYEAANSCSAVRGD